MAQANAQAVKSNTYTWQGIDRKGNKTTGEISSASAAMAKAMLRKQGVTPKRVTRKSKPLFESGGSIKPMDIAIFTRQLATMMKAGVPLIQSFDIVGDGLESKAMAALVREIRNDVAGGSSFAQALSKHPRYFDELFVNLVSSGEQSGALETMLDRVAIYKEKSEALKSKIKKAMKYPATVIVVAIVVTGILLVKVVPQFATTFSSFGADLPMFTQMVVDLSEWTQQWWFVILAGIIAFGLAYREATVRSKTFRDYMDALFLKLPIVGNIINQAVYARFSRTLATTFAAGVPLVDALDSVAGAAGNAVYYRAIKKIRDDVTTGIQLNASIRETDLFPSMLIQMVAIGEESGALDSMLDKVATHYEAEVDNAVDGLTSMMEPLIMSVLGILVGGLMIAMYLPIFMLGSVM
jgi:type IV pilus assembly protein PilC